MATALKKGAELRMRGGWCSRGCSERRHKIFNDCAEYLTALSSRLQVLHRFSYLLNKNSSASVTLFSCGFSRTHGNLITRWLNKDVVLKLCWISRVNWFRSFGYFWRMVYCLEHVSQNISSQTLIWQKKTLLAKKECLVISKVGFKGKL